MTDYFWMIYRDKLERNLQTIANKKIKNFFTLILEI